MVEMLTLAEIISVLGYTLAGLFNFWKFPLIMKKYTLEDVKIGDQLMFSRSGIDDFRMYWTVIDFHEKMIRVKIDEMGCWDELYIDAEDIEILHHVFR